MRLFHVSEDSDIQIFEPRIPYRSDIDHSKGLIWAITEACLPNFLTPRDCPRVAYYATNKTKKEDITEQHFSSSTINYVVAIENKWFEVMRNTTLYIYEFDTTQFYLQDEVAGYYVSEIAQVPINKIVVTDLFTELFKRNIELRVLDHLWDIGEKIKKTSLNWSLCRMGFAQARPEIILE